MYIDQIQKTSNFNTKLFINKQAFLHILPDFSTDTAEIIKNINIGLNNCQALYVNTRAMKFASKIINPKLYFYKLKEDKELGLTLTQSIPSKLQENKFIIIDHTILSQGCAQLLELEVTPKKIISTLFDSLKSDFTTLKAKYPTAEHIVLMNLTNAETGLIELINNFKLFNNDLDTFKVFDKYILVSICAAKDKTVFFPLACYDEKGNLEILTSNISKIK